MKTIFYYLLLMKSFNSDFNRHMNHNFKNWDIIDIHT